MLTIKNPKTFDWANMALSDCCEVNEVYYDKDGKESSWVTPMTLKGCIEDSTEDLKESYALLMSAFDKPVFEYPEDDE